MLQTAHFKRCIQTLDASFALLKQARPGSVEYDVYRNAIIKGFELVFETGGKLLGKYLKQFFASPAEVNQALLQGCTAPCRKTWPTHARRGQTLFFLSGQQESYSSRLRRSSGVRGTEAS